MESLRPQASVPMARRTIFVSFRAAAIDLWGHDGLAQLGTKMTPDARAATIDPVVLADEWLPEAHVMAWYEAAWEGPAHRDDTEYRRFLDGMMDRGFGRVRKMLLNLATPAGVVAKAAELWRHDHTTGDIVAHTEGKDIEVVLQNHVYTTTPLSRLSISEIIRYAASLSRTKGVTETHALDPSGALRIRMRWS